MIRRGKFILFVEYVFVDAAYRDRGVGKQLMLYIDRLAKDKNAETIKLSTNKDAKGVHQFYEKMGYRNTDWLMRKDI